MTTLEINNHSVERFLVEQTHATKQSVADFVMELVVKEMERQSLKRDIQTINDEMRQFSNGTLQLKLASSLLDEL